MKTLIENLTEKMYKTKLDFRLRIVLLAFMALFGGNMLAQTTIFHEAVPTFSAIPMDWTSNNAGGEAIFQSATNGYLLVDNASDWVVTKAYNLSGYTAIQLSLDITSYDSGTHNPLVIEVSNDNGSTWTHSSHTTNVTTTSYVSQGPYTITANGTQVKFRFKRTATSGRGVRFRNIKLVGTGSTPAPTITVSSASLSGFTYQEEIGPSQEQSFTVSGANLTHNISITAPTNYEISTATGAFSATSPITLTQSGGNVSTTTIYTRLKQGLSAGNYNAENISIVSTELQHKQLHAVVR